MNAQRRIFIGLVLLGGFLTGAPSAEATRSERIRSTIEFLASMESRISGYPGSERATEFVETAFEEIGVEDIRLEEFEVTIPIDRGSELVLGETGERFELRAMWPNLVRTTTLPPEGLDAPMIYGGYGEYGEFNGRELKGRVVLLEFNTWNNWLHAASLGARAIVFIAPEHTTWRQGASKFLLTPLNVPRFWIDRESGESLRAAVGEGELRVHLESRMDWEKRPTWNIWGVVPGRDPERAGETIIVEAYYDGISVVPGLAPSAETACSITALFELGRHLKATPPARTVDLAATAAHFQAQRGIADFLDRHARTLKHYANRMELPLNPRLFISLDLSSQTDQLGIWNNTSSYDLKRFFVPFGRRFTAYADTVSQLQGRKAGDALVNGISPVKGMDWSTFVPGGVSVNSQSALNAGLVSLAFVTVNDSRFIVDTPLDRPSRVKYGNLERQVAFLNAILGKAFDDPELFADLEDFGPVLKDKLRSLRVRVRAYPRRSPKPDRPLPGAIFTIRGSKSFKGVRGTRFHLTDDRGETTIPGLNLGYQGCGAYVLDSDGNIIYAPDLSERSSLHHGKPSGDGWLGKAIRWTTDEKVIVVFPCFGKPFFGLIDPQRLTALRGLKVIDSAGRPAEQYGFTIGMGLEEPVGILFGPNEPARKKLSSLKILMGQRMMLLNSEGSEDEERARGIGYSMEEDDLIPTGLLAAQDMWNLNEARLQTMRTHAIENQRLSRLHERGRELIDEARNAMEERRWDVYVARVRAALGLAAKAYPDTKGTLNDVIRGMVFFLALVIPAAFFGERLIFAAPDIRLQLAGFGGLLLVIWIVISQIHPAFAIAHPLVILLGFAIMFMSCFVLSLLSSRFNAFMKEHKAKAAQVHEVDISRVSAAYAAFTLGISNMRRRRLRTGLTLVTLTLLTFTVLSFTSFRQQIRFMAFTMAHKGSYEGVLIRDRGWNPLSLPTLDYARSHFGEQGTVSPRNWYIADEKAKEEKKYIEIRYGDRSFKATGLLGVSPRESLVTGMDRALEAGSFFTAEDEESCLLTGEMAASLGIAPNEVGRTYVQVFGRDLLVRGLMDAEALEKIHDLDDETLTPADFQLSSLQSLGPENLVQMSAPDESIILEIRPFVHLRSENVLIMPYEVLREAGGSLRSVAIRFDRDTPAMDIVEKFLTRISITLFTGIRDPGAAAIDVFSYTSMDSPAVEGFGALIVPMVIAALIVLNAMLGAVYERFREIGVYSSVGLAPMHIALLFVAESCVYAVLGVTLGYILGQGLGKVLIAFDLFQGMNLNYSSMSAIISALVVMAVVLLSTIYPARVAERTAVPDAVRRWVPPPPDGDRWIIPFPFMVGEKEVLGTCGFLSSFFQAYSEESLGKFYASMVQVIAEEGPKGREYAVRMLLWLAPFDMGVSQYVQLEFVPSDITGAYSIEIFIQRISGQDTFWQRVNHRFMNELRKEFLIWYTLDSQAKAQHREKAEGMLSTLPAVEERA